MASTDDIRKKLGANIAESISKGPGAHRAAKDPAAAKGIPGERQGVTRSSDVLDIEVGRLMADPDQPRTEFEPDAIARMASSLKRFGQVMPIVVRWSQSSDRYVIIAGERRWRGAMEAGLTTLKAVVRNATLDSGDILAVQLVENLVREDLSAMDQARAYRSLMDKNGWSGARLAEELSINQPRVVQALALLDLPRKIQERIEDEELKATTAYELSKIADPIIQEEVAARVIEKDMKRDEVREEVRKVTASRGAKNPGKGRGGKVNPKAKAKPAKPWKHKLPNGVRVTIEYGKVTDPAAGEAALVECLDRFRQDFSNAVA